MTPILIFFSWAWAETAMPSATAATTSPPSRRAAFRTSIKTSLEKLCIAFFILVDAHHMGSADRCQAPSDAGPTPGRRRRCQLFERAEPRVGKCCHARAYARARRASTSRRGLDCARVELPELRNID